MIMFQNSPADAYRRVAVDARIQGASQADLAVLCYEHVAIELNRALRGHEDGDPAKCSDGLTRANAAITALEMGLDRANPLAGAMLETYDAARAAILDSVVAFDSAALRQVRDDFAEIGQAFAAANQEAVFEAG